MSAPSQTPVTIKPSQSPAVTTGGSSKTVDLTATSTAPRKCPPGTTGPNCDPVSTAVQKLVTGTPVQAAAPVSTPSLPVTAPSPRVPVKTPKFNSHVDQQAAGGPNPPSLTPATSSTTSGPPPATPTIPPSQIPDPKPIPPKPIPPTEVAPRAAPPVPPVVHVNVNTTVNIVLERDRHPGDFRRFFPVCTFERFPDRFRHFNHIFFDFRFRHECHDFREEFDDDDDDRFRPFISRFFGRLDVVLVEHILGLVYDSGKASQGRDVPTGGGIWVLGVDGQWYRVNQVELDLINQIESTRRIDFHQPIIIGGGSVIGLHTGDTGLLGGGIPGVLILGALGLGLLWVLKK